MQKIYIALVDTPGLFAWMIRRVIKINYIHVVLSLDEEFTQAYSIGRRNPFLPLFAGFEREDIYRIYRAFPTARYKVYTIDCTQQQKENIFFQLRECYRQRFRYHYCIIGLFYLLAGKPFYQKRHYTCFLPEYWRNIMYSLFRNIFPLSPPGIYTNWKNRRSSLKEAFANCAFK